MRTILVTGFGPIIHHNTRSALCKSLNKLISHFRCVECSRVRPMSNFLLIPFDTALILGKTQCLVNFWLPLASSYASNNGVDVTAGQ